MPPFIYFLVLLSVSLAAVIGLRLTLLRTGRHIQKHVGLSDTALNGHSRHVAINQLHDRLRRGSRVVVVVKPRRGYGARAKGALTWMQQHWCPFMLRPAC